MKTRTAPLLATLLLAFSLIGCPAEEGPAFSIPSVGHEPLVVFLVRHAEKVDSSADPELTAAGRERAAALASVLRSADLEHVHSSDYIRTRDTAGPTAADHDLDLELYDTGDLDALTEELLAAGGRHLVVGHSNTTPSMVGRLGGDLGGAIDEHHEFDRLYVVMIGPDGATDSALLRYGVPWEPAGE